MKLSLVILFTMLTSLILAQEGRSALDQAYPGGTKIFRVMLTNSLQYPREARGNGTVGTSIFSFGINCETGLPFDFEFETLMGDKIEEDIIEAIQKTKGNWVKCSNDRSERIRIKISFTINDEGPVAKDALVVINAVGPGIQAMDLDELLRRATKSGERGKYKKAEKYINQLIARDPDNLNYRKMLENLQRS